MALQVPISFKDLAVRFSEEEWRLLQDGQREFYRDVMRENYETLVSVEAGGATAGESHQERGQKPALEHSSQGEQPQQSLHLTALVQLVKEIPEFLFGEVKGAEDYSESGSTSLDGEQTSPEDSCGCGSLPSPGPAQFSSGEPCKPPQPGHHTHRQLNFQWPSWRLGTRKPLTDYIGTDDKPPSIEKEGAGASAETSIHSAQSLGQSRSYLRQDRGSMGAGTLPENSPLQGLINCLKEILVPRPQPRGTAPDLPPSLPGLSVLKQTRAEVEAGSLPCPGQRQPSGDCPLQGLLNCLKEIPKVPDRRPSPSGASDLQLQGDPGKGHSGEPGRLQTPPPRPSHGAGSMLATVKVEDGWAQSPPAPASCQLSRQGFSSYPPGDSREGRVPRWGPMTLGEEATREPLLPLSLQGYMREGPGIQACGSQGTPTSFSSASSSDGDLEFRSPRSSQGQRLGKGLSTRKLSTPGPRELPERDPCSQATGCLALLLSCQQGLEESRAQELGCRQRRTASWRSTQQESASRQSTDLYSHLPPSDHQARNMAMATRGDPVPSVQEEQRRRKGEAAGHPWPAAGHPWPAAQLEERPEPKGTEDSRDLEPGHRQPSAAARTQEKLLSGDPPEPPSKSPLPTTILSKWSPTSLQPPCPCGRSLQQELHNLGTILTDKLDRLAAALAGLTQDVATMRTQMDQLRRRPRSLGPKGQGSWRLTLPQRPRWVNRLDHRHLPYWRQKGPTRPRPKILRTQAEGCKAGDRPGLSRGKGTLVCPLPPDAALVESSSQQISSPPGGHTVLTAHPPLEHTGCHQNPLSPSVPTALVPLVASPATSADTEPQAARVAAVSILNQPKEPNSRLGEALSKDLWGGDHRDPRWGAH
ncbi:Protein KRBA1 [Apodemus speciosus]|uniref:Protein KRBA1 n=1 Tax=Apodemus speciosus TaxID=105296 RepID=A0ABQ0EUR0_APOSI